MEVDKIYSQLVIRILSYDQLLRYDVFNLTVFFAIKPNFCLIFVKIPRLIFNSNDLRFCICRSILLNILVNILVPYFIVLLS